MREHTHPGTHRDARVCTQKHLLHWECPAPGVLGGFSSFQANERTEFPPGLRVPFPSAPGEAPGTAGPGGKRGGPPCVPQCQGAHAPPETCRGRGRCVLGTEGSGPLTKAPSHQGAPLAPGSLSNKADFPNSEAPSEPGAPPHPSVHPPRAGGQRVSPASDTGLRKPQDRRGPDATGHMVSEYGRQGPPRMGPGSAHAPRFPFSWL